MLVLLDIVVGISFVYLLLALISTTVNEWVAGILKLRSRTLEVGIRQLLGPAADAFYAHPLIGGLSAPGRRPSYIPAHLFSSAVIQLLDAGADSAGAATTKQVERAVAAIGRTQPALEEWFNNAMDRVSGWYKRKLQIITFAVALVVTLVANADTLQLIGVLWRSPVLRASILEQARERLQGPRPVAANYPDVNTPVPPIDDEASAEDQDVKPLTPDERAMLDQLVGWSSEFRRFNQRVCDALTAERTRACADEAKAADCRQVLQRITAETRCTIEGTRLVATDASPRGAVVSAALFPIAGRHLFGWLLTIAAISMGAAFWFDTLKRFMNIRSAGASPDEKKK